MDFLASAQEILFGESLQSKLTPIDSTIQEQDLKTPFSPISVPQSPARCERLQFRKGNRKFPTLVALREPSERGVALHYFANHELLAIEMMAAALLMFPHDTPSAISFKQGVIETIQDEQRHLLLYIERMKELGVEFGDIALNGFFWNVMPKLKSPESYLACMALTFESANLDFALFYQALFQDYEDPTTAKLLREVYRDEIKHVRFGVQHLSQMPQTQELWDYYRSLLPFPLTPARARGNVFQRAARLACGLKDDFIHELENYKDDYLPTKRRERRHR